MSFIYLNLCLYICLYIYLFSNAKLLPKFNYFIKKKNTYNQLINLINDNEERPIILNGNKTLFKKDFIKIFSEVNNLTFREYTFNRFILDLPHKKYRGNVIYISDFFLENGRVLNSYEEVVLSNIVQTKNLIILETENIENMLNKYKIIKLMKKIDFPTINKKDIQDYIYDTIEFYKYNEELYLLNWLYYDIDKLDIEHINILLFQLNMINSRNNMFNKMHNNINDIINSLISY